LARLLEIALGFIEIEQQGLFHAAFGQGRNRRAHIAKRFRAHFGIGGDERIEQGQRKGARRDIVRLLGVPALRQRFDERVLV